MKIAHLSDTHIGHTRYARTGAKGINQREIDVFHTFRNTLDAIEARDPDLVLHSGDLFDKLKPSIQSLVNAYRRLSGFQERRGNRPFVIVAGNHETPRMAESLSPLAILGLIPGVRVCLDAEVLEFPDLDLELLAIPDNGLQAEKQLDWVPTLGRKHRVLSIHGLERSILDVGFEIQEAKPDRWSYVGLGDFHIHKKYAANACYAGSTDFTSTNIWEESRRDKGWVWFDTEVGELEFCPISTRKVVDLPKIEARGLSASEINDMIGERAKRDLAEVIARQLIWNVHPLVMAEINQKQLREIRERCFHYEFDVRRLKEVDVVLGTDRTSMRTTIEESWGAFLAEKEFTQDVKREAVKELGLELIKEVRERETTTAEA